jgi:hypothetical protein
MVGVLAVGAWFAWRYYQNYKAGQTGGGVPQLGSNLNSVAPFLVGGSSGPAVSPAVNTPVNITITETGGATFPDRDSGINVPNTPMIPTAATNNPLENANTIGADTMQDDTADKAPLIKGGGYGGAG